jgi:hypothetical protein
MTDKIPPTALGQNQGLGQSQNLINQVRISKVEPLVKPPGFYKGIVLDAIGVIAAFFAGYAYFRFLEGSWPFFASVGAFLLFAVVLTLEMLLGEKVMHRVGVLVLQVAALLAPFYVFDAKILVASAVVLFVFLITGHLQGRAELDHGTTVRFFRSTHGMVAKTVTASLLVAIILYLPMANPGTVFVSESTFSGFFNWAAGLIGNFYPTISFAGSFNDFAQSVAKEEFTGNVAFEAMPQADQDAAISVAAGQIEGNLSKSLGVTASATSSTSDIAYEAIRNMLQGWSERFSVWFTVGWAISLFLVLRSVGVIAVWIGQFFAMIAYELLLSAGIVRIVEEPQTKEVIEF